MTIFDYPFPWLWVDHDGRISLVSANGNVVTEIIPGQVRGKEPPKDVKISIAEAIARATIV